ncbi:MAG TPA: hypothetical protein VGA24_04485 [Steroidobacteraceae bacterium]
MIKGSMGFALAAFAAAILGLAGCASQKEPAEQALAAIEKTFKESGAGIEKYLPERHAEVSASIASLREAMSKENFGDVVAEAGAVQDALRRAVAESRIRHAQMRVEMESEWTELTNSMPGMIDAVDKKIAAQGSRPPKGMEKDAWKSTIRAYDAARDSWSKAAAEITTANFEASVLAARDAKAKIAEIMESLGLEAS